MNDKISNKKEYHSPVFELISFKDIVSNKMFKVPDYQRGYSWENKQIKDLLEDIENLIDKNHKHYTGTIVATQNEFDKYDIIDGQQRMTTLIVIISYIYHSNKKKYKHLLETYLKRGKLGNQDLVLKPNSETIDIFEKSIIENKNYPLIEFKSQTNVKNAKESIAKWLKKDNINLDKILEIIQNQLGFIFYLPKNNKEIGIMFEVINNRGKDISELEKIKNYFIYYASVFELDELRKIVNTEWIQLLRFLNNAAINSNEEENKFLRYCYLVFYEPKKNTTIGIYELLKSKYNIKSRKKATVIKNFRSIKTFIEFLSLSAKNQAYFYNKDFFEKNFSGEFKSQIGKTLKYLRCQPSHASMMPLILAVMARFNDDERDVKILNLIEKVNFRTYILPKVFERADSQQANVYFWAHRYYNNQYWNGELVTTYNNKKVLGNSYDLLRQELIQFVKYYCNREKFINVLRITDENDKSSFYDWPGLRYLLACYEEKMQKEYRNKSWDIHQILKKRTDKENEINDFLSKEHIWAENNLKDRFPKDYIEKRRLGNYVLLGISDNSSLQDIKIQKKFKSLNNWHEEGRAGMEMYQIQELPLVLEDAEDYLKNWVKKTFNYYKELSKRINDIRENKLISFALEKWSLPGENISL